jgi:hypothetical protein
MTKRLWSIRLPYEYDDWANSSWYSNFDYQNYEDLFLPGPAKRYLGERREYVDKSSDVNIQYGECSLKVRSVGWYNWLDDQMERTAKSTAGFMELDNQDHALDRSRSAVLEAFQKMIKLGIMPILKNPTALDIRQFGALKNDAGKIMTAGCVFEAETMDPVAFANARSTINTSLGATWVRHGGKRDSTEIRTLTRLVGQVPRTSVQWGPKEYNGMRILASNPIQG